MSEGNLPVRQPPGGQVLIYRDGALNLQVRLDGQTVWLSQAGMAELYQTTPQNITLHIRSIYDEGELHEAATCKDYLQVRQEGDRQVQRSLKHYSLDMILGVGYRVRSPRGTLFRQWATALRTVKVAQPPSAGMRSETTVGGDATTAGGDATPDAPPGAAVPQGGET